MTAKTFQSVIRNGGWLHIWYSPDRREIDITLRSETAKSRGSMSQLQLNEILGELFPKKKAKQK